MHVHQTLKTDNLNEINLYNSVGTQIKWVITAVCTTLTISMPLTSMISMLCSIICRRERKIWIASPAYLARQLLTPNPCKPTILMREISWKVTNYFCQSHQWMVCHEIFPVLLLCKYYFAFHFNHIWNKFFCKHNIVYRVILSMWKFARRRRSLNCQYPRGNDRARTARNSRKRIFSPIFGTLQIITVSWRSSLQLSHRVCTSSLWFARKLFTFPISMIRNLVAVMSIAMRGGCKTVRF